MATSINEKVTDLLALAQRIAHDLDSSESPVSHSLPTVRVDYAKKLIFERGCRERFFGWDLFGEPAWDMLLDLYVAQEEHRTISVSSAVIASRAASTTGLRWIDYMIEEGVLVREPSLTDRRVSNVHLTEQGMNAVERYLDYVIAAHSGPSPKNS